MITRNIRDTALRKGGKLLRRMFESIHQSSKILKEAMQQKLVMTYPRHWAPAVSNLTTATSSLFSKNLGKGCGILPSVFV